MLSVISPLLLSPDLNLPTIPAKAGIHEALIWIPAFAGMIGVERMVKILILNRPYFTRTICAKPFEQLFEPAFA